MSTEKIKTEVQLSIKAEHRPAKNHAMFLHHGIADIAFEDGTKGSIDLTVNGSHVVVRIGEFDTGNQYLISVQDIVTACLNQTK
jgi:hypothetical protein